MPDTTEYTLPDCDQLRRIGAICDYCRANRVSPERPPPSGLVGRLVALNDEYGVFTVLGFLLILGGLVVGLSLLQDQVLVPLLKLLPGDLGHGLIADLKCGPGASWSPSSGCY